jgi:hypothetical protein
MDPFDKKLFEYWDWEAVKKDRQDLLPAMQAINNRHEIWCGICYILGIILSAIMMPALLLAELAESRTAGQVATLALVGIFAISLLFAVGATILSIPLNTKERELMRFLRERKPLS